MAEAEDSEQRVREDRTTAVKNILPNKQQTPIRKRFLSINTDDPNKQRQKEKKMSNQRANFSAIQNQPNVTVTKTSSISKPGDIRKLVIKNFKCMYQPYLVFGFSLIIYKNICPQTRLCNLVQGFYVSFVERNIRTCIIRSLLAWLIYKHNLI